MKLKNRLKEHLQFIYKEDYSDELLIKIHDLIRSHKRKNTDKKEKWNESDIVLITYGDSITNQKDKPLAVLQRFLKQKLSNTISTVHILPFFPYSSDDGFSVIDYKKVNPELGSWFDIENLEKDFYLMFDLVINHISRQSKWFQGYLKGENQYLDFFIEVDPQTDLSEVIRPRSLPLLTKVITSAGEKHVWTTFSDDQIDLNFSNPEVLVEMLKVLLVYIEKGTKILRLDAIAFLWKNIGTSCLHLPKTHQVVKLIRDVMEYLDPTSIVLTETNVPNKENLSYFGNGDEAHMVYQFSLPPLLLYTLYAGDSKYLNQWAVKIPELPENNTFFNFTASHDGIGVRPLEGLLPDKEKELLFSQMVKNGGQISTKTNPDGSESPYELNITYFDALKETKFGPDGLQEKRFICSQIVMAALQGIPAFYIHSLTATQNYIEGVRKTGRARTINRKKWNENELLAELSGNTKTARVFNELISILKIRKNEPAFHPSAWQEIIDFNNSVFLIRRTSRYNYSQVLSVSNITRTKVDIDLSELLETHEYIDIITGKKLPYNLAPSLLPYQTMWVKNI